MANTHFSGPVISTNGFHGNLVGKVFGDVEGRVFLPEVLENSGFITIQNGLVILSGTKPITAVLPEPRPDHDDGKVLIILSVTETRHMISAKGSGFNSGGPEMGKATLSGLIGDGLIVVAYHGKWYVITSTNATFGK